VAQKIDIVIKQDSAVVMWRTEIARVNFFDVSGPSTELSTKISYDLDLR